MYVRLEVRHHLRLMQTSDICLQTIFEINRTTSSKGALAMHQKRRLDSEKISKFRTGQKPTEAGVSTTSAIAVGQTASSQDSAAALLEKLSQTRKSSHYIPYSAPNEHSELGYDIEQ